MRFIYTLLFVLVSTGCAQPVTAVKDGDIYQATLADGQTVWVPKDPANSRYQEIQKMMAKGGTVQPADPPPDPKPGLRRQLIQERALLAAFDAELAEFPSDELKADRGVQAALVQKLRDQLK